MTSSEEGFFIDERYRDFFSKLASDRRLFISEDITKDLAKSFSAMLLYLDSKDCESDITVYINTYGGDLSALSNMYDIMHMIRSPVSTVCIGKAYSAGAILLAAGSSGKRFISKNSEVMIHKLQCDFPYPGYTAKKDSEVYFKFLETQNKYIMEVLSKHTKHSIEKLTQDSGRDYFMSAQEALNYNIVDAII